MKENGGDGFQTFKKYHAGLWVWVDAAPLIEYGTQEKGREMTR